MPDGLRQLVEEAIHQIDPEQIILFGSRARGDARPDSDYDIGFFFDEKQREAWLRFLAEAGESTLTLQRVDWVDLNQASETIRNQVLREGKMLYVKTDSRPR